VRTGRLVRKIPNRRPRPAEGKIILKWILKKWDGVAWTGLIWLRCRQVAGTCECGNEPSGSIKCGEFFLQADVRLVSQARLCSVE